MKKTRYRYRVLVSALLLVILSASQVFFLWRSSFASTPAILSQKAQQDGTSVSAWHRVTYYLDSVSSSSAYADSTLYTSTLTAEPPTSQDTQIISNHHEVPEEPTQSALPRFHFFPTCNSLHEVDLQREVTFGASEGYTRLSATIHSPERSQPRSHLRMLRWQRSLDGTQFLKQTIDVVAMEKLSASPYIVTPLQFCGTSVVSQFIPETLRSVTKHRFLPQRQRLVYAGDVLQSLADLHAHDVYHMDVQMKNILFHRQKIQRSNADAWHSHHPILNDFNLAWIWNHQSHGNRNDDDATIINITQPVYGVDAVALRPPSMLTGYNWTAHPQWFDMYSVGNVIYEIWTRRKPFDSGNWTEEGIAVYKQMPNVWLPPLPSSAVSPWLAPRALQRVVQACFAMQTPAQILSQRIDVVLQKIARNETMTDAELDALFGF